MRPLDWVVMFGWLAFIVSYGLYRGRGSTTVNNYLLAGKSMPWYAMGLSIMATQASAITFISTTGQSYTDGMRFVQFYFGLPIAMVILSATAVPIFHRANVYTAYEYLEQRFDAKTRALVSAIFLIQRGLAAGLSLYAPAVVLSVILGWPDRLTTVLMGALVVTYTALGGIKAVTWADVQQMMLILCGLVMALVMAIHLLPGHISFGNAVSLAGAAGKLNAVNFHFDWNGVNAALASRRGALPPEFLLLRFAPEPWRPADSLVWGKLIALQFAGNYRGELQRARLAARCRPKELAAFLYPEYPKDAPIHPLADLAAISCQLPSSSTAYAALPPAVGPVHASNNWVVDSAQRKWQAAPRQRSAPRLWRAGVLVPRPAEDARARDCRRHRPRHAACHRRP